ncbi:MAG: ferritin-like domain-containing protein [Myxococcales bacterium FL481]|nr:MAG: ferritin-like domain-containing protein [Myxococcales bacterium FL481]
MEIREFAERVLFGDSLADKLTPTTRPSDRCPGAPIAPPDLPARPASLTLRPGTHQRERFPTRRDLERDEGRGIALHFFANHELLALEAMALALLRFPDAPAPFRRELTVTMSEEQKHFSLYTQRMAACGIELGTVAVNDFFWRATRDAPTWLDFVVRMGLCFEQANLDYAHFYAQAFAEVGDRETADVLELVYREEIIHVRRGLRWFRRALSPGEDEFEAFAARLTLPLSPARARGREFCADARRRAGMSPDFIAKMATSGGSRGRPPEVHAFTPTSELCVGRGPDYNPPARFDRLRHDLQTLPMFLAAADDIVIVDEPPRVPWLEHLQQAGYVLPEFVVWRGGPPPSTPPRVANVCAWGFAPQTLRWLQPWLARLTDRDEPGSRDAWSPDRAALYSKVTSCDILRRYLADNPQGWLCDQEHVGRVANDVDEVRSHVAACLRRGSLHNVIKGEFGVSGRNLRRIRGELMAADESWLRNQLHGGRRVIVEPWLDRVYDLSLRMRVSRSGRASVQGIGQFFTDERGQYKGAILGSATANFDQTARRFANDDGRQPKRLFKELSSVAQHVAGTLGPRGYEGLVGVDALVFRDRDRLRLKPIVEINARPNMGHVAHGLSQALHPGRVGLWLIVPIRHLERAGFRGALDWADRMYAQAPLQTAGDGANRRLVRGALLTTDPARAQEFVSIAIIADCLEACAELLLPLAAPVLSSARAGELVTEAQAAPG